MQIYNGIAASPGIAIGEALLYTQNFQIIRFSISDIQVEREINRFYEALRKTKAEYEELRKKLVSEMSEDEGKFLDAHILMTEDPTFINTVVEQVRESKINLEAVIYQVIEKLSKKFAEMEDEYFQERAIDIIDIGRKIMRILMSQKLKTLADLDKDVIVVSTDLTVSDTASMNKQHVLAFLTEVGGKTSHAAILARSLGIPSVLGVKDITHNLSSGDLVIVDGINGKVIVNPDNNILNKYKNLKQLYEQKEHDYLSLKDFPSETLDGKKIKLKANMEIPEQEIDSILLHGAEGIGLYRSEFLYLSKKKKSLPTEEEQFNAYKFVLENIKNHSVTIRTLDLGGDKVLEDLNKKEDNPYLGWRAIRFCLARPDIFKTQLRALYRASIYGNLKIMFPMISSLEEIIEAKKIINEVKRSLKKDNIEFKENVPIGVMVETPSAALLSDELAKHCNFFSIGTNDLIQYTLACDRGNQKVAYLYEPLHPAILKLIKMIIDNGHKNNIKVSLCGEMGSEVKNAIVLLGLDIDELSMSPISILEIKKTIRNIKYEEARKLALELIQMTEINEIKKKVDQWIKKNLKFL